ncbi:glucosamine inositolphosphorylceramide transferase family protein [Leadbettera azotonutricia]|uniref:glucosamine inositolphosphorylceramide transferase family protein n=1 Tax=Leadbettera azotonutricia TaxID=150829 RepID=UPI003CCB39C1
MFYIIEGNNDIWYIIPETHKNRIIDLYRASDFPYKWDYTMTLMHNVTVVDLTVSFNTKSFKK